MMRCMDARLKGLIVRFYLRKERAMSGKQVKPYTAGERLANRLENNNPLMPFFAVVAPYLGLGGVDRLICKRAADYTAKRLENLVIELEKRIDFKLAEPRSDVFMSALYQCLPGVLETQSEEKVRMFAEILAGTWNDDSPSWDEVAQSLRLVRQLEDIHIVILRKAAELSPADGGEAVTFKLGGVGYPSSVSIEEYLPNVEPMLIASCISDLVAMGLINDTFATSGSVFGNGNAKPQAAPVAYSISPLGRWLLNYIAKEAK